MSSDLLRAAGEALYGPSWRRPMASALGVAERTIYRWADRTSEMPLGAYADLAKLAHDRCNDLAVLVDRLERAAQPQDARPPSPAPRQRRG